MSGMKSVNMLEEILKMIPKEVNVSGEVDFDKEIENKNYKPYVYYSKGVLKVFRVNKKNLDTLLAVYDYGELPSKFVGNFEANLFLDKDKDSKVIKALPNNLQKEWKNSMYGHIGFREVDEFTRVFDTIKDKLVWEFK